MAFIRDPNKPCIHDWIAYAPIKYCRLCNATCGTKEAFELFLANGREKGYNAAWLAQFKFIGEQ